MRLPPLPADQWDETVDTALKGMLPKWRRNPENAGTILATLVRHPALTQAYLGFNVYILFNSTLPARLRELMILRIATLANCDYEAHHHIELGKQAGLTPEEISAAARGEGLNNFDSVALRSVDELNQNSRISDETWAELSDHLDEKQRMDLVFTVGSYRMLAMAINTFDVQLEQER
jgi:4-carboxymuconolactone decarboxylase